MTEMTTHPQMLIQNSIGGVFFFFIFLTFPTSHSQEDEQQFSKCNTTAYSCGTSIQPIGYPFWGDDRPDYCGHSAFKLKCESNDYATIDIGTHTYRVLEVNESSYTIRMARLDLWDNHCPQNPRNMSIINNPRFGYSTNVRNLTLYYNCTQDFIIDHGIPNNFTCGGDVGFYADESFSRNRPAETSPNCTEGIQVPVPRTSLDRLLSNGQMGLQEVLNWGFEVVYNYAETNCSRCVSSAGTCGSFPENGTFLCLCHDHPYSLDWCQNTTNGNTINMKRKLIIGFSVAGGTILIMSLGFYIYLRRNKKYHTPSSLVSRDISSYPSSVTDLEKAGGTYMGVQMFTYIELEQATDNFDAKKELGDGGFGTVYLGKLKDGRSVAVKRLYENNFKRVEQFMNEVEILTNLRHPNLVTLYGCTSRHCRELLLVYEYIPNGTVADHLHGERRKPGSLPWNTRMSIAIETASALAYLHSSDVVHRDVKTNNILLDNSFSVKVADFGLSRLFPINVTHVSTAPQGTPGYVDPEYHECYQLTDKSDVYSFGVVLVELISSLPAVDITRHRHEINLSNMAMNKIQSGALHELVDQNLRFESDSKLKKMISDVAELAFQCLQSCKDMRPSMEMVLETLKKIQDEDNDKKKGYEKDKPAEVVVLLKNDTLTLSPDSVTASWMSTSTTSNASH